MLASSVSTKGTVSGTAAARLRAALHGELILPGDAAYETARRVFNGGIDRFPALVVRGVDANDVQSAVAFAHEHRLALAVRGGGHNLPGFSTCDGGVVLDLSPMKQIVVNPQDRTARVQPGVKLGELIQATEPHDLLTNTGTASDTGIAGLTLGGGEGWLMGRYGLTCDNVRSFDVVMADGRLLRAASEENSDLFWALRGGGGNFGVVTAFEYQLHPVGPVLGGMVVYPLSRARSILELYREFVQESPDELTTLCAMRIAPNGEPVVAIGVCYCGDLAAGERVCAPLHKFGPSTADLIRPTPYSGLFALLDSSVPPGRNYYMKGSGIESFNQGAMDALVDAAENLTSAYSIILVMPVRGAATRVGVSETAFAYRAEHYEILHLAGWDDEGAERHERWARQSHQALQRFASQHAYVNFLDDEGTARVRAAYGPNYERLVALKNKYDPDNVFHLNQNIRPTIDRAAARASG